MFALKTHKRKREAIKALKNTGTDAQENDM